jgi:hypothetical protein
MFKIIIYGLIFVGLWGGLVDLALSSTEQEPDGAVVVGFVMDETGAGLVFINPADMSIIQAPIALEADLTAPIVRREGELLMFRTSEGVHVYDLTLNQAHFVTADLVCGTFAKAFISPDGEMGVIVCNEAQDGRDVDAYLVDFSSGDIVAQIANREGIYYVVWSPDSAYWFYNSLGNYVRSRTGDELYGGWWMEFPLLWFSDSQRVLYLVENGMLIQNVVDGTSDWLIEENWFYQAITLSPDENRLAVIGSPTRLFDIERKEVTQTLPDVHQILWSPIDASYFAVGDDGGVWYGQDGEKLGEFAFDGQYFNWSQHGRYITVNQEESALMTIIDLENMDTFSSKSLWQWVWLEDDKGLGVDDSGHIYGWDRENGAQLLVDERTMLLFTLESGIPEWVKND